MGVAVVAGRSRAGSSRLVLLVLCSANLALVVAVASSLTIFSDVVAPLTGHLIGIGLSASVALLTARISLLAVGTVATLCIHAWLGLAPCCQPPAKTYASAAGAASPARASRELSVVALNTWHGNRDPARIFEYLVDSDIDVAVLSEFGPDKSALLRHLKASHPYQVHCAGEWACSLAIVSRVPFESSGIARAGAGKPAFAWARLGGTTVVGTHLHRPSRNPWLHEQHVAALAGFVGSIPGPVILAGDLNTTPWSSAYRTLRRSARLAAASRLQPTWPAWPVAFPQVALDHILVSQDLTVTATGAGPAVGSDHLPVWATVQLPVSFDRGKPAYRSFASGPAPAQLHLGAKLLAHLGGEHGGARNLSR